MTVLKKLQRKITEDYYRKTGKLQDDYDRQRGQRNCVAEFLSSSNQQHLFVTIVEGLPKEDSDFGWSSLWEVPGEEIFQLFCQELREENVWRLHRRKGYEDIAKLGGQW